MAGRHPLTAAGLVGLLALAAAVVARPGIGRSHAVLVKASPAARAVLAQPPGRVELVFTERLEPAYSRVSVRDDAGRRVDRHDAIVGPGDPRVLSVSLPTLPPGTYTVHYRVLSIDSHIVESSFSFTVAAGR